MEEKNMNFEQGAEADVAIQRATPPIFSLSVAKNKAFFLAARLRSIKADKCR
jgi:hypothetical protein